MRVERFSYDLPAELIAQHPAKERELARLRVLGGADQGRSDLDATIADLADHVEPGSLVVVNDTKVLRARILGTKESGGKAEVFLVRREPAAPDDPPRTERWRVMARASKPMRPGTRVTHAPLVVEFLDAARDATPPSGALRRGEPVRRDGDGDVTKDARPEDGLFLVRLSTTGSSSVDEALAAVAQVPLPPYIKRDPVREDEERYQTIFAREPGAVAAPTAGLHLTGALVRRLEARGCELASCTLHVGLGTFEPVKTENLDDHPMHAEYFTVSRALASSIARARERGAPVVAVGTTVVRALESAADPDAARTGHVRACAEETRILIQPGYTFRVVDRLLTNFHLPRSTLLALVCAFGGTERVLDAYRAAVRDRYRFFSYGDAMLLSRSTSSASASALTGGAPA